MNAPSTFKALKPTERKLLLRATSQGVKDDDRNLKPRQREGLTNLEAWGLIHLTHSRKKRMVWKATDTGRGAVAATGLAPYFLHRQLQHNYTRDPKRAVLGEPEAFYADAA